MYVNIYTLYLARLLFIQIEMKKDNFSVRHRSNGIDRMIAGKMDGLWAKKKIHISSKMCGLT